MSAGDRGRDAQIALPQPARRAPRQTWRRLRLRRHAGELRVGVVHVEDFVAQDLLEDRPRLRVVVDQLAIDREAAGGGLLRDVQEREQAMVRLALDAQIVEAVAAGQRRAVEKTSFAVAARVRSSAAPRSRNRSPWCSSSIACSRYSRRSSGSGVTSAARRMSRPPSVSTSRERQQLAHAPIGIAPHPAVDGPSSRSSTPSNDWRRTYWFLALAYPRSYGPVRAMDSPVRARRPESRSRSLSESVVARPSHPAVVLLMRDVVRRGRVSRAPLDVRRRRRTDRVRAAAPRPPGRALIREASFASWVRRCWRSSPASSSSAGRIHQTSGCSPASSPCVSRTRGSAGPSCPIAQVSARSPADRSLRVRSTRRVAFEASTSQSIRIDRR